MKQSKSKGEKTEEGNNMNKPNHAEMIEVTPDFFRDFREPCLPCAACSPDGGFGIALVAHYLTQPNVIGFIPEGTIAELMSLVKNVRPGFVPVFQEAIDDLPAAKATNRRGVLLTNTKRYGAIPGIALNHEEKHEG